MSVKYFKSKKKVIAYSFHYLFSGFQKVLPWTRCDAWWNSANTKESGYILVDGSKRKKNPFIPTSLG